MRFLKYMGFVLGGVFIASIFASNAEASNNAQGQNASAHTYAQSKKRFSIRDRWKARQARKAEKRMQSQNQGQASAPPSISSPTNVQRSSGVCALLDDPVVAKALADNLPAQQKVAWLCRQEVEGRTGQPQNDNWQQGRTPHGQRGSMALGSHREAPQAPLTAPPSLYTPPIGESYPAVPTADGTLPLSAVPRQSYDWGDQSYNWNETPEYPAPPPPTGGVDQGTYNPNAQPSFANQLSAGRERLRSSGGMDPREASQARGADPRSGLLSQIRQGRQLRHVEPEERDPGPQENIGRFNTGMVDAMQRRRASMGLDQDDQAQDDDEYDWGDDPYDWN